MIKRGGPRKDCIKQCGPHPVTREVGHKTSSPKGQDFNGAPIMIALIRTRAATSTLAAADGTSDTESLRDSCNPAGQGRGVQPTGHTAILGPGGLVLG